MVRDDDKVKRLIASNIAYYRKKCNLTQAELAEKIFYSDKSVSKWERAEGVPDICVLVMLAELFGVTVNDLIAEKQKNERPASPKIRRNLIMLMSVALVWLVSATAYFALRIALPGLERTWLAFIVAVPVSFVVTTVLTALWYPILFRFLSVSALVWSIAMALDVCVLIDNMYLIYTIAAILQILVILWHLFIAAPKLIGLRFIKRRHSKEDMSQNAAASSQSEILHHTVSFNDGDDMNVGE